ncbi:oligosaccharide flippase family protein [Dehalobacter sp. TeCB1]|uniref:lipopolysaccharide biosynthesis protein n=1 Tax=Dehalobacter sp. TeCB1 TaxID=1843715 RepID=UPI00083B6993|nr:oligosaccharide flippase family protein [Dehalobacter sp. TeCB1]OCZ49439.1 sugar lyase [Dehalobacter sp. TeCB1]
MKNKVLKNSFLYTFNSILIKALGFLLLPVYTYFLTPKDYGITNLIAGFTSVASFVVAFSLYSAVTRFYADYKSDRDKLKRFYGTVLTFVSLSGIVFVVLSIVFQRILLSLFFKGLDFYPVVLIGIVGVLFGCIYTVYQNILQGMQDSKKFTITSVIYFLFNVALNLIFIGIYRLGATGVLLAGLIANITFSVYVVFDLRKSALVIFGIDKHLLHEALKYSLPILPHNLSTSIADFFSRILLNSYKSLSSVGLFSIATQFGSIADMIQGSVNMAFAPWFYETMNKNNPESKEEIIRISDLLIRLYGIIFLGIALFCQEAVMLMTNSKYVLTWTVIPILVFAFSVKSIYFFYVNVLFYYKQASKYIFLATLTGSLINVLISFLLIPNLDMYGAALAFVVAKIIVVIIVVVLSLRFDKIGYKLSKMIMLVMINAVFCAVGLYFSYTKYITVFNLSNFLYKILVFVLYTVLILFTFRKQINEQFRNRKILQLFKIKHS